MEVVAFPQDGVIRRPGVLALLDEAAANGATNIGGIDPASIDRDPVAQLDGLFDIAERRGVGLDIHLHDRGELGAFQNELIVQRTQQTGLTGRVNLAHGFALGQLPANQQTDLLDACAEAGISVSTVAPIGSSPLPWAEMRRRGMVLGLGTDGIRDLWSPYGDGDVLRIAANFARLHGFRHDQELTEAVELATGVGLSRSAESLDSGGLSRSAPRSFRGRLVPRRPLRELIHLAAPGWIVALGGIARFAGGSFLADHSASSSTSPLQRNAARFVHRPAHDLVAGSRADIVLADAENVPDALVRVPRRSTVVAGGRVVVRGGELQPPLA